VSTWWEGMSNPADTVAKVPVIGNDLEMCLVALTQSLLMTIQMGNFTFR
jgi:hypothetical protein